MAGHIKLRQDSQIHLVSTYCVSMTEQDWKHKCQQIMISVLEELRGLRPGTTTVSAFVAVSLCVVLHLLCSHWSLQLSSSVVGGPRGHPGTVPMLTQKQSDNSTEKKSLKEVHRVSSS